MSPLNRRIVHHKKLGEIRVERMTAAGNTEIPAYLTLQQKGFRVERNTQSNDEELWIAERDGLSISGASPIEVLGLYYMRKKRGENWKAEDSEIDAFMNQFYPNHE